MLENAAQKKTWRDQQLGNCPFKEKRTVADASGTVPTARCEGPTCELWLREEPRADSPGACSLKIGGLKLIHLNAIAGQERLAINNNLQGAIGSLQMSINYLIKMLAKIGGAATETERAEIETAETKAHEEAKRKAAEE